jgi:hypothetical protein
MYIIQKCRPIHNNNGSQTVLYRTLGLRGRSLEAPWAYINYLNLNTIKFLSYRGKTLVT